MKINKLFFLAIGAICTLTFLTAQQNVPLDKPAFVKSTITITGDALMLPLFELWQVEYERTTAPLDLSLIQSKGYDEGIGGTDLLMYSGMDFTLPESKKYWQLRVAREAVVPIFNSNNSNNENINEKGLTPDELIRVFLSGKMITWGDVLGIDDPMPVHVIILNNNMGAAEVWARFLYAKPDDLKGRVVYSCEEMIEAVQSDPLALGFCDLKYAYQLPSGNPVSGIAVLPLDLNVNDKIDYTERIPEKLKDMQRVIWLGSYPNTLCRPLTLIAQKRPDNQDLHSFLNWILSDEGQALACKNGYCRLSAIELKCQLNSLKCQ